MAARRRSVGAAFTALWLVVWTSAILVACYFLLTSIMAGEYGPVPILALWLAAAGVGLWRVGLRFAERLSGERLGPTRRRRARHRWQDDLPGCGGDPRE